MTPDFKLKARLARIAVTAFFAVHTICIAWWLIPADGYPRDERSTSLVEPFHTVEDGLHRFKKRQMQGVFHDFVSRYIALTASWQKWWLFSPNPHDHHKWISVRVVENGKEETLYRSFSGERVEERFGKGIGPYRHDHKLAENLASGDYDRALASFADYWARAYERRTGKKPEAVHVVLHKGPVRRGTVQEKILWHLNY